MNQIAVASLPSGRVRWIRQVPGELAGLAFGADTVAASTRDGDLFFFDGDGQRVAAPRPVSEAGRRFPAFRETGPFVYGDTLAIDDGYLATSTSTGRLAILDRHTGRFVVATEPQFPLAEPIDRGQDPILYETENTRPISAMTFLPNGFLLFAEGEGLRTVDPATGRLTRLKHCKMELPRQFLTLPDRQTIAVFTLSTFELLRFDSTDPTHLACLQRTTLSPKNLPFAALAADGKTVFIAFFDGEPELWQPGFRIFGVLFPFPRGF